MTGSISGLPVVLVTFACSGSGRPSEQPVAAGASKVARIVCDADGSTAVPAPDVLAQPDGVHVKVGHLDEPASVSVRRIGWDVDPGLSRSVAEIPPGRAMASCWPFSEQRCRGLARWTTHRERRILLRGWTVDPGGRVRLRRGRSDRLARVRRGPPYVYEWSSSGNVPASTSDTKLATASAIVPRRSA